MQGRAVVALQPCSPACVMWAFGLPFVTRRLQLQALNGTIGREGDNSSEGLCGYCLAYVTRLHAAMNEMKSHIECTKDPEAVQARPVCTGSQTMLL